MSYYKHFIFACLAAIGACAVSCSDDTFGTDNNNIDGRLHFRAKVIQNKQLTKGSRAAQPADACIEARNIQGPSFQGKTIWLQERTINGIFPSSRNRAATRGDIIPSVDYLYSNDYEISLWGYRAKKEERNGYETWFANEELKIDDNGKGTFGDEKENENGDVEFKEKKYFWSADKPYCKFFALFGKGLDVSKEAEFALKFSYHDENKPTAQFDFACPECVSDQFDLLAASKDVNYNQEKGATVTLELCHALTAVQFSIGKIPVGYTLTKVELLNIVTKGTYTFPTTKNQSGEWTLSGERGRLYLNSADSGDLAKGANTILKATNPKKEGESWVDGNNNTFFVIPQEYKNIKVRLTLINKNKNENEDKNEKLFNKEIPIVISLGDKGKFDPGTTKIFNLSFDNSWNTFITEGPGAIYVNADLVNFNVFSYSRKDSKSPSQPEKWEYVGYEDDKGNIQKGSPNWLTVETKQGDGGYNTGNIRINYTKRDIIFPWDKKLADATPKGDDSNPYNLANKEGKEDIQETANCYVISAPGTYAIPLVYGNAFKNGEENQGSYSRSFGTDDGTTLLNFKNSEGKDIASPCIKTATDAKILWQDRNDMLSTSVKIVKRKDKPDYLQFKVTKEQIKSGNALVAVTNGKKDSEGNLLWLWSWHLWFVPEKEYGGTAYYKGHNIAEYPLGYTPYEYRPDEADRKVKLVFRQKDHPDVKSKFTVEQKCRTEHLFYMTYYQYGRKDPFSGDVVHAQDAIKAVDGQQSLAYGIQHPNQLINFNYEDNWCKQLYYNLWSTYFSINGGDLDSNNKTIYDPCPAGYKVPPVNTFHGIGSEGGTYDADKYGWTFSHIKVKDAKSTFKKDLFIPMSGYVNCAKGKPASFLYYVKNGKFPYPEAQGFYQLATTNSSDDKERPSTTHLFVGQSNLSLDNVNNLAEADAVLPVKDE